MVSKSDLIELIPGRKPRESSVRFNLLPEGSRRDVIRKRQASPLSTPDAEQTSIDEDYFDLCDARKSPVDIAMTIGTAIGQKLKLSASEGIGTNKLVTTRPIPAWLIVPAYQVSEGPDVNTLHLSGLTRRSSGL